MALGRKRRGSTLSESADNSTPNADDPALDREGSPDAGAPSVTGADDEIAQWVRRAALAADDKLGQRTDAFFVGDVLGITDWFVITSGNNSRQVKAIVEEVEEKVALDGGPKPVRIEGLDDNLNWVLMDYGSFVVHVFDEEAREYYDLERLWQDVRRLDLGLPAPEPTN